MNKDSSSSYSDYDPESAKQIQGLADLLTNMLTTENNEEAEVSLSVKKSNKSEQNQPRKISHSDHPNDAHNSEEIETIDYFSSDIPSQSTELNASLKVSKSTQHSHYTIPEKDILSLVKKEPKDYAKNEFLETEIEGLRNILANLESRIYNHQELI